MSLDGGAPKSSSKVTTKLGKSAMESPDISMGVLAIPYRTELGTLIAVPSCSWCLHGEISQLLAPYAMIRGHGPLRGVSAWITL